MINEAIPKKKQLLLEAATKMFAELGFHDVKLGDVAKKAGVAKGTIYTYFKSKDTFFCDCIFDAVIRFNETIQEVIYSQLSYKDKLRELIKLQFDFYKKSGTLIKQIMELSPHSLKVGKDIHEKGIRLLKKGVGLIASYFQEGIDKKILIDSFSATQMAIVFIKIIDVNALSELFGDEVVHVDTAYMAMERLFCR